MTALPYNAAACMAYALWRQEEGPIRSFMAYLAGLAPRKPSGYEAWKKNAWPGFWP